MRTAFLAALAAAAWWCIGRVDFGTDITGFMPDARRADLAVLARHLAHSDMARTMFLTVGIRGEGQDADATARIARAVRGLADKLKDNPEVAWLRTAPADHEMEAVYKALFPHRLAMVSLDPEREIPAMLAEPALAESAVRAREALASPTAALVKRTLPADPLGLFGRRLAALGEESPALSVRDGVLFSRDGHGVLVLATASSAFDSGHQTRLLADIAQAFREVAAADGASLVLEMSGANRFAVDAETAMKRDMWWIAGASFLGIAVLFLAYFRSPSRFLVSMLPALAGMVVATAGGLAVFGRLDGLTIAFGASLIGVAIDYPIHLLNHLVLVGGARREAVRRLAPSIGLGAFTTMASFAGLGLTSFPGFREIAFFAVVGIAGALATTLLVVPFFVGEHLAPTRSAGATAQALGTLVEASRRHRRALAAVPWLVLAVGLALAPRLVWQDDLSTLGNVSPGLQAEEERVRERVSPFEMGRVAMVTAPDTQTALERGEEVARRLRELATTGAIAGARTASDYLYSASLQARNDAEFRKPAGVADRVVDAFAAAGFRPESFSPFRADLAAPAPAPLVPGDLTGTGLDLLLGSMVLEMGDRTAVLAHVRDPRDEAAVRAALADIEGATYFVQRDFVNELYAEFRTTTLEQVGIGCLLVVAVLGLRYRRWRPTLAAFLPSALVAVLVLAGFAATGEPVNLLHIISLIMVMGMGVDYGIFLVDAREDPEHFRATLVSLLLSCLTTVFVFGTLAISEHPALRAMGTVTGLGVLASLVLAPVSLVVVEGRR